jgi:hypothetical protein
MAAAAAAAKASSASRAGCINRPTTLGLGLGACALIGMLLMVEWIDLLAAYRRQSRLAERQHQQGGDTRHGRAHDDGMALKQEQHAVPAGSSGSLSNRPVGVVLQRTVALVPFGDKGELGDVRGILVRELGLGVQFDMSTHAGVIVSAVDAAVAAESGLAVGDRVVSLAGVLVAADHDPLAALDEAEDAIRGPWPTPVRTLSPRCVERASCS